MNIKKNQKKKIKGYELMKIEFLNIKKKKKKKVIKKIIKLRKVLNSIDL